MPGLYSALYGQPEFDWMFYSHTPNACKLAGDSGCFTTRGKMLGGSSAINSMIYARGFPADFNSWAASGNPGWDWNNVLPYFKKYEGNKDPEYVAYDNGYYHNANGPVKIKKAPLPPYSQFLADHFKEAGAPFIPDVNANWTLGYSVLQSTAYNGVRSSTAQEYLAPNKNRTNLHVVKHAFVTKVLINQNNKAYGVEFTITRNGKKYNAKAFAKLEVIVSAGTIQSPQLLMRSGIGPIGELKKCNIIPKAFLPVGENYIDHLTAIFIFKYNYTTPVLPLELITINSVFQYVTEKQGPFASVPFLSAYINTKNVSNLPDIQNSFLQFPMGTASQIQSTNTYANFPKLNPVVINANKEHAISILTIAILQPKSRGYIRISDCCECEKPYIYSGYLTDPEDQATMVRGIKNYLKLIESPALQKIGMEFVRPPLPECDPKYPSDEYWYCYMKYVTVSGSHMVGTGAMGSVVDSRLKVKYVKGLREIDAAM